MELGVSEIFYMCVSVCEKFVTLLERITFCIFVYRKTEKPLTVQYCFNEFICIQIYHIKSSVNVNIYGLSEKKTQNRGKISNL